MDSGNTAVFVFLGDETGQDLVEYGLIMACVALGTVIAMKSVAANIGTVFGAVGTTLTSGV